MPLSVWPHFFAFLSSHEAPETEWRAARGPRVYFEFKVRRRCRWFYFDVNETGFVEWVYEGESLRDERTALKIAGFSVRGDKCGGDGELW